MYLPHEQDLIELLDGALPGAPVLGTFDVARLTANKLSIQVLFAGANPTGQSGSALKTELRFSVQIVVDAARARDSERTTADQAINECLKRLLGHKVKGKSPSITGLPAPEFDGQTLRFAINLTIIDVVGG